jgi:hypothetical protein
VKWLDDKRVTNLMECRKKRFWSNLKYCLCNEPLGFVEILGFLEALWIYRLLKDDSAPWIQLLLGVCYRLADNLRRIMAKNGEKEFHTLRHLRLSKRCCWRLQSSDGRVVVGTSKNPSTFILRVKQSKKKMLDLKMYYDSSMFGTGNFGK